MKHKLLLLLVGILPICRLWAEEPPQVTAFSGKTVYLAVEAGLGRSSMLFRNNEEYIAPLKKLLAPSVRISGIFTLWRPIAVRKNQGLYGVDYFVAPQISYQQLGMLYDFKLHSTDSRLGTRSILRKHALGVGCDTGFRFSFGSIWWELAMGLNGYYHFAIQNSQSIAGHADVLQSNDSPYTRPMDLAWTGSIAIGFRGVYLRFGAAQGMINQVRVSENPLPGMPDRALGSHSYTTLGFRF